jgi:hypothetical protein
MKIQAISSWQNGQEKLGTEFNLRLIGDDLATTATFYYSISSVEVSHIVTNLISAATETEAEVTEDVKVVTSYPQTLVEGNLTMSGEDYQTWDSSVSANEWAYNWALAKLNLVAVV